MTQKGEGIMFQFRWKAIGAAALFLAALPAAASAELLTLAEAEAKAAASHHDLTAARLQNDAARFGVTEAAGHLLPTGRIEEIYLRSNNPVTAFGTDLNQGTFSLMDFQTSDPNDPDIAEDHITRLSAEQPIFAGGKISAGLYQAAKMKKAAGRDLEQTALNVAHDVETAYYAALRAEKFIALSTQVAATMEQHLRTARDAYDAGLVLESEVLQAEVYLAKARVALTESANNRRLALAHLNFLTSEDQAREWTLAEPDAETCSFGDNASLVQAAWANRPDLAAMDQRVKAARAERFGAASGFCRRSGFRARSIFTTRTIFSAIRPRTGPFLSRRGGELFSGFRDASRTARAAKQAKIAEVRARQMREGAALEVRRFAYALDAAEKKLATAATAVRQSRRHLGIMENRHEQGLIKIAELLDAQTAFTEARTDELNAGYDVILARRALLHATGRTACPPDGGR
ncbi:MAG: TolC family protein [Deltaproteobacteria bacterium]|nr:TolC family protein [Deltaproteobacteria bacterium]